MTDLMITLDLPWPPSVNSYWRSPNKGPLAGRTLISEKGRAYRSAVITLIAPQRIQPLPGKLALHLHAYPPDARRRDVDNLPKAILDALQHAGVIRDDGDIDDLRIIRKDRKPGGLVRAHLYEYFPEA